MRANYMIVRQKVTDLTRFQTTFDRLKTDREAAGLTDLGQFCATGELDVVRAEAGVVGPIDAKSHEVWLTDGLVKDRLAKPKRRRRPVDSHLEGWLALAEGKTDDYENSSCKRKTEKGI
jgi:hypothetical protein